MKVVLLICVAVVFSFPSKAQTFDEWFRQKKTQREYLAKQIALLQQYIGYVKKGYGIANKGLTTISQIKNGDLKIHEVFFASLKRVNPSVKRYPKVADIFSSLMGISTACGAAERGLAANDLLDQNIREYIHQVFSSIRAYNRESLADLLMVTENDRLQLSDDQRLSRIDTIYKEVKEREAFCSVFIDQVDLLVRQRRFETADITMQKVLYGLK
ncbi:hypothetical protein SAMN04488128_1011184 [Chitinophaga eiseniae]|uniref:TerB family tellurite resistance protein n=1 Tax=Chitinophaga eiseniae TaxID=634771 RepID=A0A1T4MMN2_9BACT|nr:hypothetical protein [Chitinophaga eiseniae]SJZ68329.1 hypothetical protein SAMN04488128_1011184 [Chitinophaga eiseniae]